MRFKIVCLLYGILAIVACIGFIPFAGDAITYTMLKQNKEETIEKYENVWDNRLIQNVPNVKQTQYLTGEIVATITIPRMDYYEMPIYYGSNEINNNWQITTPGYLENWDMFGEEGVSVVGAHNYQLFSNIELLEIGDLFIIETTADIFIYEVSGTDIYDHSNDNWKELSYDNSNPYSVTLMTCYPIEQGAEATKDTYLVYSKLVNGTKYITY